MPSSFRRSTCDDIIMFWFDLEEAQQLGFPRQSVKWRVLTSWLIEFRWISRIFVIWWHIPLDQVIQMNDISDVEWGFGLANESSNIWMILNLFWANHKGFTDDQSSRSILTYNRGDDYLYVLTRASGLYSHITEKIVTPGQCFRIAEEINTTTKNSEELTRSVIQGCGYGWFGKNQAWNKYSQSLLVKTYYHFVQAESLRKLSLLPSPFKI